MAMLHWLLTIVSAFENALISAGHDKAETIAGFNIHRFHRPF